MTTQKPLNVRLQELIHAQTHDIAWLFEASKHLTMDVKYLEELDWDKHFWRGHWGSIERVVDEDSKNVVLVWHRPDGASPVASSDQPTNVTLVKFALLAELIVAIKGLGQLTYARVGFPLKDWHRCKVFQNGVELQMVYEADALLGQAEIALKGANGKVAVDHSKGEVKTKQVKGVIQIIVEKESQAFF